MGVLVLLAVAALLALIVGTWLLLRFRWLAGFLVGLLGIAALGVALALALLGFRFNQYEPVTEQTLLGTLSMRAGSDEQTYRLSMTQGRSSRHYEITGEQWRLSGTLLEVPQWALFGPTERYFIVHRVEGRFSRLEDELLMQRDEQPEPWYYRLADSGLRQGFRSERLYTPLLPLAAQAIFTIEFRAGTIGLRPVNEPAREALGS